jgi:phage head maturation protease
MSDEQADIFSIEVPLDGDAVQVRDATKRELDIRLLSWGEVINTASGTEEFVRGAFDVADPSRVRLMGMEHAAQFGIGQDGKPVLVRVPTGKGIAFEDRDDGPHMTFRVAKTSAGDDQLALATEGIVTGASVEFSEVPGGTVTEKRGSRRHRRHVRADLSGLTTTYRPAYAGGAVLAVRSEEEATVSDTNGATPEVTVAVAPPVDYAPQITQLGSSINDVLSRLDAMQEEARAKFDIPAAPDAEKKTEATLGDWSSLVFRMLTGEKISQKEIEYRIAAELITTDNLGVVPEQFLDEIIGIIDPSRPFLDSTRRLQTPAAGMTFNVPVIETRPTVGVQAAEKDELTSTETSITDTSFTPLTIGGYGDISIQLLKRSDPSYLSLYLELLSEAYGIMADDRAVDALLAAAINNGGNLDPDDLSIGAAWSNAMAVSRRLAPDTIWLSSDGVARFINAKASGTNAPLYSNLAGNFTTAGGVGGTISGLRPVHVPALDDEAADVIIGPSRGFAWAEDGTYTLQVDVPALAGREVALVGMIWFMPLYPAAFTRYALTAT